MSGRGRNVYLAIERMRQQHHGARVRGQQARGHDADARLFDAILEGRRGAPPEGRVVIGPALPVLKPEDRLEAVATARLGNGSPAVLVEQKNGFGILTKQDIIRKLK